MILCPSCGYVVADTGMAACSSCGAPTPSGFGYGSSDRQITGQMPFILDERRRLGLDNLTGGLAAVIVNTEKSAQQTAVAELIDRTGYRFREAYQDLHCDTCVLAREGSADILVRSRLDAYNPFSRYNQFPEAAYKPNTRLETFVFETTDIDRLVDIQRSRGVRFLTEFVVHSDNYAFIQTPPSKLTGTSTGFIQWRPDRKHHYSSGTSLYLTWQFPKPEKPWLDRIGFLDHAALRVRADERSAAILEFMILTGYTFEFAIHVASLNSITSVTRRSPEDFALVFTSGETPYLSDEQSGPTEKFVHSYGTRTHHLAFRTEDIEDVCRSLSGDGMTFLSDLAGSEKEGLRQIFSVPSPHTLLVTEYIQRYGDFDGFFTRSNVTALTRATGNQ